MWPFTKTQFDDEYADRIQERIRHKLIKNVLKNTPPAAKRDINDKYRIAFKELTEREKRLFDTQSFNYVWLRDILAEEGYITVDVNGDDINQYELTDLGRKARKAGGPAELIRREKMQWWMEMSAKTVIPVLSLIVAIVATCNNRKPAINTVQVNADSLIRSRAAGVPVYMIHDTVYLTPWPTEKGKHHNDSAH